MILQDTFSEGCRVGKWLLLKLICGSGEFGFFYRSLGNSFAKLGLTGVADQRFTHGKPAQFPGFCFLHGLTLLILAPRRPGLGRRWLQGWTRAMRYFQHRILHLVGPCSTWSEREAIDGINSADHPLNLLLLPEAALEIWETVLTVETTRRPVSGSPYKQ